MAALAAFRLYLCFQTPLATGDIYRQLGFASHAFIDPWSFYRHIPSDWQTEPWTIIGGFDRQPYIYPPVALSFFAAFAAANLGIFWVKLFLLFFDFVSALLMSRFVSRFAGILLFAAPQALWYSAREGQYEGLQSLLVMLTVIAVWQRRWLGAGILFGLAVQTKLFAVCLIPWILGEVITAAPDWKAGLRNLSLGFVGIVLTILPFLPFYLGKPELLLAPLIEVGHWKYSSFFWNPWHSEIGVREIFLPRWLFFWNNLGSLLIVAAILFAAAWLIWSRQLKSLVSLLPYSLFWMLIKSCSHVREWYIPLAPSLLFPFARVHKKWAIVFLLLQFAVSMQGIAYLTGERRGYLESPDRIALYQQCMYRCRFR